MLSLAKQIKNNKAFLFKYFTIILFVLMKGGYSRNKIYKLPTLLKQSCELQQQQRRQKQLLMQVQKIDSILKSDNLKSMHGFIFTNEIKKRLSQDLLNCIHKQHRLISYGFQILSKNNSKEEELLSSKIILNHISFKTKLQNLGIRNVQEFETKKNQQLSQLKNQRWQVKPLRKRLLNQNQRDFSALFSYDNISKSNATTPRNRRILNEDKMKNKFQTEISQSHEKDQINLHKIEKMIERYKDNLVGIWLPPKSYPQFYGIIEPNLIKTASQTLKCRLKKYILFKQGLNSRLFQAILQYLSEKYQLQIENLELIVRKQDFYIYFEKIGCKIKSWEGTDKVSICYFRKKEFQ